MSTALRDQPAAPARSENGGVAARRAVMRWAWRMFRREWRQQLLVLSLIVVAVAATFIGAAVATNTPPAANAGFGTAGDLASFQAPDPHLAGQIAALRHRFGRVDVIENQTVAIPGSVETYDLRAQDPHGPFGQPMLSLVSGQYPTGPGQAAVTQGVATAFNLNVGDLWHQGGTARRVTGIVSNPQDLVDEFALVAPGQVTAPTQVTVLFDAPGVKPSSIGPSVQTPHSATPGNQLNPTTIVLALATIGMLLIALVGVGGFTVLAQRRLRSLGMLGAQGASDKHIRLVVRANGVVVGVAGTLIGAVLGLIGWLAYRPVLESDAHHTVGVFALPWAVILPAMALAIIACYFAASRPARQITRTPIVTALSGRPAPPKRLHRTAVPGIVILAVAFGLLTYAGSSSNGSGSGELVLGLVALVVAMILLAPFFLTALARLGSRTPIAARLALRDLARYRARSGSALAAISLGVLIAVLVCVESAARFGNVLDYAGPNLASNQIVVYTPNGPGGTGGPGNGSGGAVAAGKPAAMAARAHSIAAALGSHDVVQLDSTGATLQHAASGRQFSGQVYVATPQLLAAFGIKAASVDPAADILTMRPGLSGISRMQLVYGHYFSSHSVTPGNPGGNGPGSQAYPCPASDCLANPVIQEVGGLPSGTSAPNTVITEHALQHLHQRSSVAGWLIQAPHPPTAAQISNARLAASAAGMTIETKNSIPTTATILNWATVFGIALALGILAMSVGLIRSETAGDLRTLTATGASSSTRRLLTAITAGALGLLGALLGTAAAYVAAVAYARGSSLDGLSSLQYVPTANLLIILIGLPLLATATGWLLAGREPAVISRQALE
jgi:putative ABC transport system permease protein